PVKVNLKIDWAALGIDPTRAKISAPAIEQFQPAALFETGKPITVEQRKGWLLILEEKAK
ncbi:MAG: glycoside hydrolase domain-containing protein, partial [Opitutaceae bacterium]